MSLHPGEDIHRLGAHGSGGSSAGAGARDPRQHSRASRRACARSRPLGPRQSAGGLASARSLTPVHCSGRMVWPEARPAAPERAGRLLIPLEWPVAIIWALAATGLILLVIFDLSPPLAFNDDWMYSWSVRQLVTGHGLRAFPESTALALPQVVWGALFSLGHPDPRLLRLSVVPVVTLTAWISFVLARRLGADRFWAAVAGTTLLAMPLFMANATSFMTDNVFVGIVMAVALTSLAWVSQGKWRWLCVALLVLAPLERQGGLALIPAVTLGLAIWRRHRWKPRDTAALVAIWVLPVGAGGAAGRLVVSQPLYSPTELFQLHVRHAVFS